MYIYIYIFHCLFTFEAVLEEKFWTYSVSFLSIYMKMLRRYTMLESSPDGFVMCWGSWVWDLPEPCCGIICTRHSMCHCFDHGLHHSASIYLHTCLSSRIYNVALQTSFKLKSNYSNPLVYAG